MGCRVGGSFVFELTPPWRHRCGNRSSSTRLPFATFWKASLERVIIMKSGLMVAIAWGLFAPTFAGDAGLLVLGAGQKSCAQFLMAITSPSGAQTPIGQVWSQGTPSGARMYAELARYQEWMTGFITGYNAAHEADIDGQIKIELAAMDAWLRNWCNGNPTRSVAEAGRQLRYELAGKR